jgi:hypothetical protein
VLTGEGDDFVGTMTISVADRTGIFTASGNDSVSIFDSQLASSSIVSGQEGNDFYSVGGRNRPRISVNSFESDLEFSVGKTQAVFKDLIRDGIRLGTISELLELDPRLSMVAGAFSATGFDSRLDNNTSSIEPYTVFAPTNDAFEALPDGLLDSLTTEELRDILRFHVSYGDQFAEDVIAEDEIYTLLRDSFSVEVGDDVVLNGNATLATVDIRAKNGVLHVLNDVLIPGE